MKEEIHFDQSGVVPYRISNGELQILLITTIRKKKWIIPKGFIEFNLSAFESAKKEAYEEAGVIGANETIELGSFSLNKYGGEVCIKVYSMEVLEEHEDYSEKNLRKRKWFSTEDAINKVGIKQLGDLFKKLETKVNQKKPS